MVFLFKLRRPANAKIIREGNDESGGSGVILFQSSCEVVAVDRIRKVQNVQYV